MTVTSIPSFLAHLKTYGDYPVPFTQMWIDGKPDFRAVDPKKVFQCVDGELCAICGRKLGEFCFFIGGDLSKDNKLFADPPMHAKCAEFAAKACPFVSGERLEYSGRPVDETVVQIEQMASLVRPRQMYILKTHTKKIGFVTVNGSRMIQAWTWSETRPILTAQNIRELLLNSKKFLNWNKPKPLTLDGLEQSNIMAEKHYSPDELAELWGVSTETVRSIFREEPGVLKLGKTGTRYKRGYVTLRIPLEVAERVHRRLSA